MSTESNVQRTDECMSAMQRLNLGGSINYGARLPSGNFVHLEVWRDPLGFRYSFAWEVEPSPSDLLTLQQFKVRVSEDLCEQLGMGLKSVDFPEPHRDNIAELTIAS